MGISQDNKVQFTCTLLKYVHVMLLHTSTPLHFRGKPGQDGFPLGAKGEEKVEENGNRVEGKLFKIILKLIFHTYCLILHCLLDMAIQLSELFGAPL